MQEAYTNADDMPISDILTEIRALVSSETTARYTRDRELAVTELLILRPEARVDLVLQEAVVEEEPVIPPENTDLDGLNFSSRDELRDFIRQIFHKEFEKWSNS